MVYLEMETNTTYTCIVHYNFTMLLYVNLNLKAHLRHVQLEERRKARLVQVREQEKSLARQLRERVRNKRESERKVLKEHVDAALAEAHEAELRELESKYLSRVDGVGQGHRDAQQINEVHSRFVWVPVMSTCRIYMVCHESDIAVVYSHVTLQSSLSAWYIVTTDN